MSFVQAMERVAQWIEVFAVTVLVLGMGWSVISAAVVWRTSRDGRGAYRRLREMIGGALLLGVEILVAADLIRTVAVTPTLESVLVLGAIVLIRTFLSFSLEVEIEGVPPWRRALLTSGAEVLARSARSSAHPPEGDTPK
jgi:uncharacterized membrane protein